MDNPISFMPEWLAERIKHCILSGDVLTRHETMLFDNALQVLLDNGFDHSEIENLVTIIGCIARGHQHITEYAINPNNMTHEDYKDY